MLISFSANKEGVKFEIKEKSELPGELDLIKLLRPENRNIDRSNKFKVDYSLQPFLQGK